MRLNSRKELNAWSPRITITAEVVNRSDVEYRDQRGKAEA